MSLTLDNWLVIGCCTISCIIMLLLMVHVIQMGLSAPADGNDDEEAEDEGFHEETWKEFFINLLTLKDFRDYLSEESETESEETNNQEDEVE